MGFSSFQPFFLFMRCGIAVILPQRTVHMQARTMHQGINGHDHADGPTRGTLIPYYRRICNTNSHTFLFSSEVCENKTAHGLHTF